MKSANVGAVVTLLTCSIVFTNSAKATNSVDFSYVRAGLSGTMLGSLATSPISNLGRSFAIHNGGGLGVPSDVSFSGTFAGPVTWTVITLANGTHNYSVSGVAVAALAGKFGDAIAVRLTMNTSKAFFQNSPFIAGADSAFAGGKTTTVSSIPEPPTLTLLLTGGVGTLAMMRRKQLARKHEITEKADFSC